MYRLTQIIRNSYTRIEGLIYQIFRNLFGWLNQLFNFLSKLLGFASPEYLPEEKQEIKSDIAELVAASAPQDSPTAASASRRRPDAASMDYFLKMAQPEKKSK